MQNTVKHRCSVGSFGDNSSTSATGEIKLLVGQSTWVGLRTECTQNDDVGIIFGGTFTRREVSAVNKMDNLLQKPDRAALLHNPNLWQSLKFSV